MRPLEESVKKEKTFKASHFDNIQELLDTCKMWIRDDDYDAYCRFFDMGAMEELLNELETYKHYYEELTTGQVQSAQLLKKYVNRDELEKYKELYISALGHSLNNSINQNNKHNDD